MEKGATLSHAQIDSLLANPDRKPSDRAMDARRKPAELLSFVGARSGMIALDLSAGGGYTSSLLARAAGPSGKVYAQSAPRGDAPPPSFPVLSARVGADGNIVPALRRFDDPVPPEVAHQALDLVTFVDNYHDLGHLGVDRAKLNRAVHEALKPGGVYVIVDHAGRPGTGISESATLHRVEEAFVKQEVESAGFRFVGSGDFLRNPNDPRDRNAPEGGQAKDGFALKFVKR
ncbi:class I SAM-dependent methyltransferase [Noviherbaspirillum pedocola]|uniref:Class I SAM-dependent methyltransferase n=1 Tax=Noviherbaspirillum pedocola TaxID=2801341 RepID=A0A934T3D6_9BURK|nr:class I SAM-dependent methyltransferase [Noviherbaspirillum pedocola]MBK4737678.1 class I SAM-dependent methyltransferase [Noviherbaspirillum pedocola]